MDPITQRSLSCENSVATFFAISAPARASSYIRDSIPYSARLAKFAPKVFVSTASEPA